ncbi:NAD-dependent epimerase/dehydratase family protein [Acrocarpospora catenulata]|uniref:NAD-dependent epimerase/dehydratase family protein n=1 Tax=Acrocarpospora catenulata TaxID=2836182 RepID=UPI002023B5B4|nr:NAD-dependent epimerase/dehydratase family protein [Acrocarpospora catenulata]
MTATTYLITGGCGFIGSHLTDALLARGDAVTVLDDLSTGRAANLRQSAAHPRLHVVQGSVLDGLLVDELTHQCDVVVHLAAAVGTRLIADHPLRSLTTNIRGAETVIAAAHRYRRKILLASSSEIYGKNTAVPLGEDAERILGSTAVARWSYGTATAVDELMAAAYHRERGLPAVIARLFNTVGPRQSPAYGVVVPRLVRQALAARPLTVYGDGTQTRCFVHVLDVVDALIRLLDEPLAVGQTFNVGSAEEVSILELAKTVIELTRSSSPVEMVPYHEVHEKEVYERGFEDLPRRVPDTSRLRALTGWRPTRNLDDILLDTITDTIRETARGKSR